MITADLTGKRTLVTGGASGIGLGVARTFSQAGSTVAMADLEGDHLHHAVCGLATKGLDVFAAPGDLRSASSTEAMIAQAAERMGGLDFLVNVAGHPVTLVPIPASDLDAQTEEFWGEVLSVNLMSVFRTAKVAAPYLRRSRGAIVNTGSMSGWRGGGSSSAYSVAKGGIITLTKELARGLGPAVRVNAISPSYVAPDSAISSTSWGTTIDEAAALPLGRAGTAAEYAEVCLFLCAGASYMTGQTIHVDGGWSC